MAASCGPCAESCGLYFAKIKVRYQRVPDSDGEKDIMLVWKKLFTKYLLYFLLTHVHKKFIPTIPKKNPQMYKNTEKFCSL